MRKFIVLITLLYSVTLSAQERITLLFAGDLMQHQGQMDAAYTAPDNYDYSPCFSLVKEQISKADIAIGNLEVTLGGKPYKGYPAFSAPDEYLSAIKNAGFDILLTANNHCLDRRKKGLERTITMLDSLHISHLGTYTNIQQREQHYPLLICKNGFRIVLLNYTYATNGIQVTSPNIVNYIDRQTILEDIHKAQSMQPDAIIACMHWGIEYQSLPNREQRDLAKWMIQQGVTHIIGSHPHVVQPLEMVTDSIDKRQHIIVYSLGNFISNMSKINTDGGLMFTIELEKTAHSVDSVRIRQCGYNLVWTGRPNLTGKKNFILYPVNDSSCETLPPAARNRLNLFTKNTRNLLKQHNVGIEEYEQ